MRSAVQRLDAQCHESYRAATAEMAELALAAFPRQVSQTSSGGGCVGKELAASDPVLRISGRDPQDHLYDQRGGIAAHDAAQGDQKSGLVPHSGSRHQAPLPGPAECVEEVAVRAGLARGASPIYHPLAGSHGARPRGLKVKTF